jgi:hypothetical protein
MIRISTIFQLFDFLHVTEKPFRIKLYPVHFINGETPTTNIRDDG